ncbi:MAG TPA: tetratricopeptide repeat protein, partial [Caulobacteraceae bacterium]|nr:tetratricopeptide repeat protein [Caulobacteraceae bacterium]
MNRAARIAAMTAALFLGLAATMPAFAAAVDSRAEVAAALFAASATQAAEQRVTDATIRAERAQIDKLTLQVRSGAAQRAALVAAQDHYVAELAARDREYSAEIDVFRGHVTHIVSTPEGAEALAKYNAGDTQGALSILDELRAARAEARRKASEVADAIAEAVDARDAAELALNSRNLGRGDTASVITRYEEVVRLDPSQNWDWVALSRLYKDAGRLADAAKAAQKAFDLAASDRDRAVGLEEQGDISTSQGDLAGARKAFEASLAIDTKAAAADPASTLAQQDVETDLSHLGGVLRDQNDLPGARKDFEAALTTARRLAAADPTSAPLRRTLVVNLTKLGDVQAAQGDLAGARTTLEENVVIVRALAAAEPDSAQARRDLAVSLNKLGNVVAEQSRLGDARKDYEEALAVSRALAAGDPNSARAAIDVAATLQGLGGVLNEEGDAAGARK